MKMYLNNKDLGQQAYFHIKQKKIVSSKEMGLSGEAISNNMFKSEVGKFYKPRNFHENGYHNKFLYKAESCIVSEILLLVLKYIIYGLFFYKNYYSLFRSPCLSLKSVRWSSLKACHISISANEIYLSFPAPC